MGLGGVRKMSFEEDEFRGHDRIRERVRAFGEGMAVGDEMGFP